MTWRQVRSPGQQRVSLLSLLLAALSIILSVCREEVPDWIVASHSICLRFDDEFRKQAFAFVQGVEIVLHGTVEKMCYVVLVQSSLLASAMCGDGGPSGGTGYENFLSLV